MASRDEVIRVCADAVGEAIQELRKVPSGHLYAMLMSTGMDLDTYQSIVDKLIADGKIRQERSHLLVWIA